MTDTLLFSPVSVGRAGEEVALQLEAAILNDKIKPGERLPSERELQTQFGTGRGVIREAIRALKQKGLIEIRKGAKGGAYVKQIDVDSVSESLGLFLKQNRIDTNCLAEFRESIDRTITMLAITRGNAEQKAELVAGTERLRLFLDDPEADLYRLGELDRELNILLAQMTSNPVFEWVMRAMQLGFSSHDYALYEDEEFRRNTILNWCATANYIACDDLLQALSSIGAHYVLLRQCVVRRQNETKADQAV